MSPKTKRYFRKKYNYTNKMELDLEHKKGRRVKPDPDDDMKIEEGEV